VRTALESLIRHPGQHRRPFVAHVPSEPDVGEATGARSLSYPGERQGKEIGHFLRLKEPPVGDEGRALFVVGRFGAGWRDQEWNPPLAEGLRVAEECMRSHRGRVTGHATPSSDTALQVSHTLPQVAHVVGQAINLPVELLEEAAERHRVLRGGLPADRSGR
jgi:hypothetical protein